MATTPHKREIELFGKWYEKFPGVSNPTDINTADKYDFALDTCKEPTQTGDLDDLHYWAAMIKWKKKGVEKFPFIAYAYWHALNPATYPLVAEPIEQDTVNLIDGNGKEEEGVSIAKWNYGCFFESHPDYKNPSDIDCRAKVEFAERIGWMGTVWMHKARKASYPWTVRAYWVDVIAAVERRKKQEATDD